MLAMTPDLREALDALLGTDALSEDHRADLIAAAKVSNDRRRSNSRHGGAVIAALHEDGMSWREIEDATGMPHGTARRWAEPPTSE